ncbi:6,7-dimethyl-8-ribityllumazine synthase [Kwoniella shandongensis]|uniref:6,7-dimethyl-8-ribityllumazine synthase n=1 Tax=Kwoniella shandongensis TaxID=1734106 RepID=A0A5M6C7K2_9TREE|nr:6,7-dimethyl-8-ribityllumazine synthase [Kwoniella shandongensis]KAA5529435.1 6,7-dimethyl-8-ribityllumazine synthase [Kwoniella shandongensis]
MSDPTIKGLPPPPTKYDGSPFRIAIVHARWNDAIIKALLDGTVKKLKEQGVKEENIVIKSVPGSYELPFAAQKLIEAGKTQSSNAAPSMLASTTNLLSLIDNNPTAPASTTPQPAQSSTGGASTAPFNAIIAIGCLIKGSTMHFEYICDAVTHGLMKVQLDSGTPVVFGVLTALNDDQALERAGIGRKETKGHNHGEDWGLAAVELAAQTSDWQKGIL